MKPPDLPLTPAELFAVLSAGARQVPQTSHALPVDAYRDPVTVAIGRQGKNKKNSAYSYRNRVDLAQPMR